MIRLSQTTILDVLNPHPPPRKQVSLLLREVDQRPWQV